MAVATATAILIGAGVAAAGVGTSAYFGVEQMNSAADARKAQQKLEEQRRLQLAQEASARAAAATRAASAGSRVGGRSSFIGSLGFGSGNTNPGLGAGNLFGN